MCGSQRTGYLFFALLFMSVTAFAQDAVPVFRSARDSTAYFSNQNAMRTHDPLAPKLVRMDSLWEVQQRILRTGILGWKYTYRPDKSFVSLEDLLAGKVAPSEVRKLSISDYDGRKLPPLLWKCIALEELECINTKINKLPRHLNKLKGLHAIELYNNKPSGRLKLTGNDHVTFLKFRSDEPHKVPLNFRKFKALDSLDLSRNFLTEFPVINHNKNLKQLVLTDNNLTLKNLELKQNNTLECLYLRRNKIEVLPDAIGNLTALKKLSFNYNEIREVHDGLARLRNLEELSLYQNKLTSIPKSLYQLTNLKVIDLYYNQIEKIDDPISNLTNLEILYAANNRIFSMSENIGDLANLKELYIHHNRISYFPTSISRLTSLKVLRFNDNYFAAFPDPILSLKNLENLDISRNMLQNIPTEFGSYEKLRILVMTENPWEDHDTITAFAKRMRSNGTTVHLNSMGKEVEKATQQE
ncbi:MAG TPA: leucine-rich repeat domain-containing protein [Chryseolinea sp.]